MHRRAPWLLMIALIPLLALVAACGGSRMPSLVVPGEATDLGLSPKGLMGATYSLVAQDGGIRVLTVDEERVNLVGYDAEGQQTGAEILLNLQPELWAVDEAMLASAIMTHRYEDLPLVTLEGCIRSGLSDIARHVFVYDRGLVPVADGYGLVFGARTTLECDEAGANATVSVEHIIVFDADFNRIQHDRAVWIEKAPMDAVVAVDGQSLRAAWLASDGVYIGGGGAPVSRVVKFTDPWSGSEIPAHFFEPTPGQDVMFALGVIERPMATVGQGESYLVLHMADRADPSSLKVSRLALPEHPQAVAGAWSGDRLGVTLFAEVRPPHAESRAMAYFVTFDDAATAQGELETILGWKSALGKSFGMQELVMAYRDGTYAAAILYDQGMGGMIDLIPIESSGPMPPATHDMGWSDAKDLRLLSCGEDFLILWSDKVVRLLRVAPPYGVAASH
ncbi:MAG: hypothetical protein JRG91_01585 [Deltaproteobacteria bacterium]|nr:hypothetical protein [Deltaproteobacteria bacterium]